MKSNLNRDGYIPHMTPLERKRKAVMVLRKTLSLEDPEEELAFAVIEKAIIDVRAKVRRVIWNKGKPTSKGVWKTAPWDSVVSWKNGDLIPWCQMAGLNYGYVKEVLKHFKVLPKGVRI